MDSENQKIIKSGGNTKFNNLPPLRKWIISNKYFIKCSDTKENKSSATHYLLDGGIWKVPLEKYQEFLQLLLLPIFPF